MLETIWTSDDGSVTAWIDADGLNMGGSSGEYSRSMPLADLLALTADLHADAAELSHAAANSNGDAPKIFVLANGDAIDLRSVRGVVFEATGYVSSLEKVWPAVVHIDREDCSKLEIPFDSNEEATTERDRIVAAWQESAKT